VQRLRSKPLENLSAVLESARKASRTGSVAFWVALPFDVERTSKMPNVPIKTEDLGIKV